MIGVFDSGVGGLTVVKQIFKSLPEYRIIYLGDTARLPYGTKGKVSIQKWSRQNVKFLLNRGAKLIVIACHTSSAWAAGILKKEFKPFPIFEIITPGVKAALKTTRSKRIGVIGTPGTIRSRIYEKKLSAADPKLKIYSKACPLLVPLIEEGWIKRKETEEIAEFYLRPLKRKNIDTLILGCTHYPLLKNMIKKIMGKNVKVLDPAKELVSELKSFLEAHRISRNRKRKNQFFFTDKPYNIDKISKFCLGKEINWKLI